MKSGLAGCFGGLRRDKEGARDQITEGLFLVLSLVKSVMK